MKAMLLIKVDMIRLWLMKLIRIAEAYAESSETIIRKKCLFSTTKFVFIQIMSELEHESASNCERFYNEQYKLERIFKVNFKLKIHRS